MGRMMGPMRIPRGTSNARMMGPMDRANRLPLVMLPGWTGNTAMLSGVYFRAKDLACNRLANLDCAYWSKPSNLRSRAWTSSQ